MHSELSILRPLVELAVIMVIVGLAGCVASRDRQGWWFSQGLVVLGLLIGIAAAGELHPTSPVMSLAVWLPVALLIEGGLACWIGK